MSQSCSRFVFNKLSDSPVPSDSPLTECRLFLEICGMLVLVALVIYTEAGTTLAYIGGVRTQLFLEPLDSVRRAASVTLTFC